MIKHLKGREFFSCPSCGGEESVVVDRKYVVTMLRRCQKCHLLFRAPITTDEENKKFYQRQYNETFTTKMPGQSELKDYMASNFKGTQKDMSRHIEIFRALNIQPGSKVFDFGCSWGYGSWQIAQAGFAVESFEISVPRADYARQNLGVQVYSDMSQVEGLFDVFFSAHVLEHLPSVSNAIELGLNLLKPGGLFIAFTPNGSQCFREKNPGAWHKLWSFVHPNFLDDVFYQKNFAQSAFLLDSKPYHIDGIAQWAGTENKQSVLGLDSSELMFVARKK